MQIVPIADNGFRGPAKPAEPGRPADWPPGELPAGRYDRFALLDNGRETIEPMFPTPIDVHSGVTTLRITPFWDKNAALR